MFSSHVDDILVYKNCCGVTPFIHDNRELFTWITDHPQMSDIGAGNTSMVPTSTQMLTATDMMENSQVHYYLLCCAAHIYISLIENVYILSTKFSDALE